MTLKKEIDLLKSFKHNNIVQYFGSQIDENNVYVFLECVLHCEIRVDNLVNLLLKILDMCLEALFSLCCRSSGPWMKF